MANTTRRTKVRAYDVVRERLVKRSFLGVVNWYELVSAKKTGTELHIETTANEVYINGKRVLVPQSKETEE